MLIPWGVPSLFVFAAGNGELDTGDAPRVVAEKIELLNHIRDPLDTESAVDDSVFAFILLSDALKILSKKNLGSLKPRAGTPA